MHVKCSSSLYDNDKTLLPHKLLSYPVDLILIYLLCRVPTLLSHFVINIVLHTKGVIQRIVKSLMHIIGRGFDSTVHKKVTYTLFQ